ncbi:hypothetical protein D9613_009681 [Agrocybe pediades]|uniref:DUF6535 domain-containing protein n=1 Tax=Agrocybe pediades TaxID=84607 RepID=A0A8H4QXK5_9AGAR|nr:hypothetical protein D9613_009681 [Agrocybe pediades]
MPNYHGEANDSNDSPDSERPQTSDPDMDGFMFAPEKPDGDLWEVALEPLMKREREQCDAWKEEVQNLLIFDSDGTKAGLFSAVVTAFVIESYKTLHVDPQDTVVSLLSQILVRIENGNMTSTPTSNLPSGQVTFVPDKSAERINSFWFISLVLSLATALIGIISLQWLREYQSYANFNSEETFALFNMRKDGFEKWHVPKVFTALPLLLQAALVLFLAGMVDFSLALGIKVGIPVIIAIALTLAFLLLTTILPAFQVLLYIFRLPTTNGPQHLVPQCPYKSPQSRAFRILAVPFCAFYRKMQRKLEFLAWRLQLVYRFTPEIVNPEVLLTTWSDYDQAWLHLRCYVSQEMFDRTANPGRRMRVVGYLPFTPYARHLTDLLTCLRRIMVSNVPETSRAAAYHSLRRVSLFIKDRISDTIDETDNLQYYLSILINTDLEEPPCGEPLSVCLDRSSMSPSLYSTAFRYHILSNFLCIPGYPVWFSHFLELEILLKRWLYSDYRKLEASAVLSGSVPSFFWIQLEPLAFQTRAPYVDSPLHISGRFFSERDWKTSEALIHEYCTIYVSFFTCISKGDQYRDWSTSIHMAPEATELLGHAASVGYHNLLAPTSIAIADIIIDCLQTYLDVPSDERDGDGTTYNLLFYAASIYLSAFPKNAPGPWTPSMWSVYERLEEVRIAVIRYKARVLDIIGPDHTIETQFIDYQEFLFAEVEVSQLSRRFSAEWWSSLEEPFLYPTGEEVRIGSGEDGVSITTSVIPDQPSTPHS